MEAKWIGLTVVLLAVAAGLGVVTPPRAHAGGFAAGLGVGLVGGLLLGSHQVYMYPPAPVVVYPPAPVVVYPATPVVVYPATAVVACSPTILSCAVVYVPHRHHPY